MRTGRMLRAVALAAAALTLAGCAGLPVSGPVNAGLPLNQDEELTPFMPEAKKPAPGASVEDIVAGFLEASITPTNDWEIARMYLTEDLRETWKADRVTVDASILSRAIMLPGDVDVEEADSVEVQVQLDAVGGIDETGAYSVTAAPAQTAFRLVRDEDGEWRISEARDGVVIDARNFELAYRKHALQYYDVTWTHLVPDVRWFPVQTGAATAITRALALGRPSEWLAPAVQTAFPSDITLGPVMVDGSQVADVSLSRSALSAPPLTLARMRTQLERSLVGDRVSVREVRFSVDGSPLAADRVTIDDANGDTGMLVLTEETFGSASGGEVTPVPGLTAQIAKVAEPIASVDVARDGTLAALQLRDGRVFVLSDGNTDELGPREGLIAPSLDPFGFTWTVPRDAPLDLQAWSAEVEAHRIEAAWGDATGISHLRVAADGARVAAVITVSGQRQLVVAAVVRDERGVPVALGPTREIGRLAAPAQSIAWVGTDSVAVLANTPDATLTTHMVGGPAAPASAPPVGAVAIAGGMSPSGLRVLTVDGKVHALRGSSWQELITGVSVLGTRAGF